MWQTWNREDGCRGASRHRSCKSWLLSLGGLPHWSFGCTLPADSSFWPPTRPCPHTACSISVATGTFDGLRASRTLLSHSDPRASACLALSPLSTACNCMLSDSQELCVSTTCSSLTRSVRLLLTCGATWPRLCLKLPTLRSASSLVTFSNCSPSVDTPCSDCSRLMCKTVCLTLSLLALRLPSVSLLF